MKSTIFRFSLCRFGMKSLMVFVLVLLSSCSYFRDFGVRRDKAAEALSNICERIPILDGFVLRNSTRKVDLEMVVYTKNYGSTESCDLIQKSLTSHFIGEGWDANRMSAEENGGGLRTSDFLFRNEDYVVWVACEKYVPTNAERQITISCSWGLRNW
jgi:hypothetical protein